LETPTSQRLISFPHSKPGASPGRSPPIGSGLRQEHGDPEVLLKRLEIRWQLEEAEERGWVTDSVTSAKEAGVSTCSNHFPFA
jgi:hypothetical protein